MERLSKTTVGALALSVIAFLAAFSQRGAETQAQSIASAASISSSQPLCQVQNEEVLFISCGGFF